MFLNLLLIIIINISIFIILKYVKAVNGGVTQTNSSGKKAKKYSKRKVRVKKRCKKVVSINNIIQFLFFLILKD